MNNNDKISEIIKKLEELSDPEQLEGMRKFAINSENSYGIRMPILKKLAREIGKDHNLAIELWKVESRETRILASLIDISKEVSSEQMDQWVSDFNDWEVCDQCCINLFRKTDHAYDKIYEWSKREEEFVKRAAFSLTAVLGVHDKKQKDETFIELLDLVERESKDNRNFVKKSVNWALRQIGKRNRNLNKIAIKKAKEIAKIDSKSAKWIGKNALKELKSEKVQNRLLMKK